MKKLSAFFFLFVCSMAAFAQSFSINGNHVTIDNLAGINHVYIFDKIDNNTEIHYVASSPSVVVKWYTFMNGLKAEMTNVSAIIDRNETYIDPKNNTGYILSVDGQETVFWVFDYAKYAPVFNALTASDSSDPCVNANIEINAGVPVFEYETVAGGKASIERKFTVAYTSFELKEKADLPVTTTVVLPHAAPLLVDAPLKNTTFTLTGDQFAAQLGVPEFSITSDLYIAKAVKCNIKSVTSTVRKDVENENKRPREEKQLDGSAPLDIAFYSEATPAADTYMWKIFRDNSPNEFINRSAKDNSYTFTQAGKYKVELTASNQYCSDVDTIYITVSESMLAVPKVFTPNDDGVQDEFRVAYQSIVEFNAVVLNRWGRKLFSWTDPAKGWDGKINGRPAAEGPYYYTITAKGADGKAYKLQGCINLIR